MRKFFLLVVLGTAVCIALLHFVLFRTSKPRRGAVVILRGEHHPYIRHPFPAPYSGRRRRQNRSCVNKYYRQVTNSLKRSDQFIVQRLLGSTEYNRTITYEDDSAFPETPVNDLFPYSAFLITRDDEWHVDIIALVPTDKGRLNKIRQNTSCYIDVKAFTFSTPVAFRILDEHMAPLYSTAFVSCRYPPREKSVAVRVALATTETKTNFPVVEGAQSQPDRRCCGLVNENAEQALVPEEPDLPDIVRDYSLYVHRMRMLASPVMRAIEQV
ncbi:hypothetical protein MTO96_018782 [Rhipicephalus appendiculatus]